MPTLFQDSILAKQAHYLDPKVASHSNTKGPTWIEHEINCSTPSNTPKEVMHNIYTWQISRLLVGCPLSSASLPSHVVGKGVSKVDMGLLCP